MKTRGFLRTTTISLLLFCGFCAQLSLFAEVTAFTYQGRLNTDTGPANGLYDFTFSIYDQPTGTGLFAIQTNLATQVSNGLFTVAVDFGPVVTEAIFSGPGRWLEIAARTNGAAGYAILTPRQQLTAAPYAVTAASLVSGGLAAGTYGNAYTFNNPANSFAGNGGGLTNVKASTLAGSSASDFWQLGGNNVSGSQFFGTTNNQALEIRVNNVRAMRLEPTAVPSLEGGYSQNSTHGYTSAAIVGGGTSGSLNEVFGNYGFVGAGHGAKVGGFSAVVDGGYNVALGQFSFIGSGLSNTNQADYSFIGSGTNNYIAPGATYTFVGGGIGNTLSNRWGVISGGFFNTNRGDAAAVGGGQQNTATGALSTVGGGQLNTAGNFSTVGGGEQNTAGDGGATVAGGEFNMASGSGTTVGGGVDNTASGLNATVGGGAGNYATNTLCTVAGGYANLAIDYAASIGGGYGNLAGYYASVGGGNNNSARGSGTTVSGGVSNNADVNAATIGGGSENHASGDHSTIGGGQGNSIFGDYDTVGGGADNVIQSGVVEATIAGGGGNTISNYANSAVIGGGALNLITATNATISGGWQNIGTGSYSVVAGGQLNTAAGVNASVGGGYGNSASGQGAVVGGGGFDGVLAAGNTASGASATVAGGVENGAQNNYATVGGGAANICGGYGATIGGGWFNNANGQYAVVSGGDNNTNIGFGATISGGEGNQATGSDAAVAGGAYNVAAGFLSFAAGHLAQALHNGSFVWADSQNATFASTAGDQFNVRAQGGARFVTGAAGMTVNGSTVATSGANTFSGTQTLNGALNVNNTVAVSGALNLNSSAGFDQSSAGNFRIDAPFIGGGRFTVLTNGNVGVGTNNPVQKFVVLGTINPPAFCDGLTWFNGSDRNAKEAFVEVDPRQVLEKVAALPITEWRYKEQPGIEHMGPMAQDFHAAFGLNGADDKHISTVDEGGVALAAIQGLNQKLQEKEARISELEQRLAALEKLVRADR